MKKFIAYIPAGYPDIRITEKILLKLGETSIDGVEIGIPFSDPIADGPVIQLAHSIALKNKINLEKILSMLKRISVPYKIFLMSYLNPLLNYPYGIKKLISELKEAKVEGLIIPDLPLKEVPNISLRYPFVLFVAPNTTEREIRLINKLNPPFVYYIARYGVTGERKDLPFINHIKKVKSLLKAPLYVGFGISSHRQVKTIWNIADGVIVGSALVKEIQNNPTEIAAERVKQKVNQLVF